MNLYVPEEKLVAETAGSVLNRVFAEIKNLNQKEYSKEWFDTGLGILRFSSEVEIGFAHARATMLAVFKEKWDSIDSEIRKNYWWSFDEFAKHWTGGKAKSTYEGYILTARIWILEEYGKNRTVAIKIRREDGSPIIEHGKELIQYKTFVPFEVDMSKLLILNSIAHKNEMTERLWEMLVDDFYTCDDLRLEISRDEEGNLHKKILSFTLDGPLLVASRNGESKPIMELNWDEYEKDDLVREAIDYILKMMNIRMDEDIIYEILHRANV